MNIPDIGVTIIFDTITLVFGVFFNHSLSWAWHSFKSNSTVIFMMKQSILCLRCVEQVKLLFALGRVEAPTIDEDNVRLAVLCQSFTFLTDLYVSVFELFHIWLRVFVQILIFDIEEFHYLLYEVSILWSGIGVVTFLAPIDNL